MFDRVPSSPPNTPAVAIASAAINANNSVDAGTPQMSLVVDVGLFGIPPCSICNSFSSCITSFGSIEGEEYSSRVKAGLIPVSLSDAWLGIKGLGGTASSPSWL